jgi:hypothetical protein
MAHGNDVTAEQFGAEYAELTRKGHERLNRFVRLAGIGLMSENGFAVSGHWPLRPRPMLLVRLKSSQQIWSRDVEGDPHGALQRFIDSLDEHAQSLLQLVEFVDGGETVYWPFTPPQERTLANQMQGQDRDT